MPSLGGITPSITVHGSRPSGVTMAVFGLLNVVSVLIIVLIGRGNLGVGIIWAPLAVLGFDVIAISALDFNTKAETLGVVFSVINVIGVALLVGVNILELTSGAFLAILAILAIFELPRRVTIKP